MSTGDTDLAGAAVYFVLLSEAEAINVYCSAITGVHALTQTPVTWAVNVSVVCQAGQAEQLRHGVRLRYNCLLLLQGMAC